MIINVRFGVLNFTVVVITQLALCDGDIMMDALAHIDLPAPSAETCNSYPGSDGLDQQTATPFKHAGESAVQAEPRVYIHGQ